MGLDFPHVVVSRDGSKAVELVRSWSAARGAASIAFAARAEPFGDQFMIQVAHAELTYAYDLDNYGLAGDQDHARDELATIAIGEALDALDGPFEPPPKNKGVQLGDMRAAARLLEEERRPRVDDCLLYMAARIFWSWMFGSAITRFYRHDEIRLGLPPNDLGKRVALGGLGTWWERAPRGHENFLPTGHLIQAFRSGSFPGIRASPVIQVRRQLSAPRYQAALDRFEGAIAKTTPPKVEPWAAAVEAARSVEAMGEIVLDMKPDAKVGDVKRELTRKGHLDAPQAKHLDGLGGYRGGHAHGKAKPTTPAQARLAVNSAAAILLFLAELDGP